MKTIQHIIINLVLVIGLAFIFNACKEPDWYMEPQELSNTTIAELKEIHTRGNLDTIPDHIVIAGIVVSNDSAGNYFKTLTIQDATGGIEIKINQTNLYREYPIGQKILVKCKGLIIGDYGGMEQLGWIYNGGVGQISPNALNNYFLKYRSPVSIPAPTLVTDYAQLSPTLVCKFVKFENVSFASNAVGQPWAETSPTNRTLQMNGGTVVVRTSNYANFKDALVPSGTGTVQGVLTIFNDTYQLMLRDLHDVQF